MFCAFSHQILNIPSLYVFQYLLTRVFLICPDVDSTLELSQVMALTMTWTKSEPLSVKIMQTLSAKRVLAWEIPKCHSSLIIPEFMGVVEEPL